MMSEDDNETFGRVLRLAESPGGVSVEDTIVRSVNCISCILVVVYQLP